MIGCSVKLAQGQVWETKAFEFGAARLGQAAWVCSLRLCVRTDMHSDYIHLFLYYISIMIFLVRFTELGGHQLVLLPLFM